jgi:hypothetical protein
LIRTGRLEPSIIKDQQIRFGERLGHAQRPSVPFGDHPFLSNPTGKYSQKSASWMLRPKWLDSFSVEHLRGVSIFKTILRASLHLEAIP